MMSRRAGWVVAATAMIAASCSNQPSQEVRAGSEGGATPNRPLKATQGVLFPASFVTLAPVPGQYDVKTSQDGDNFIVTATRGDATLVVSSPTGDWLGQDANPVRCGSLDDPQTAAGTVAVKGATSSITVKSSSGVATVTATSPLLAERNPEGLRTLPGDEVKGSIVVPEDEAAALATPGSQAGEILAPWEHSFNDLDVTIRSRWAGSIDTEIQYVMEFDFNGKTRAVGHSILGIDCNVPSSLDMTVENVTFAPVLLTGGARLYVDGAEVTDLVPEPPLQGSFGLVAVSRDAKKVKVEVKSQSGETVKKWTQRYRDADA